MAKILIILLVFWTDQLIAQNREPLSRGDSMLIASKLYGDAISQKHFYYLLDKGIFTDDAFTYQNLRIAINGDFTEEDKRVYMRKFIGFTTKEDIPRFNKPDTPTTQLTIAEPLSERPEPIEFEKGLTTIQYAVTDAAGNTATNSFSVYVSESQPERVSNQNSCCDSLRKEYASLADKTNQLERAYDTIIANSQQSNLKPNLLFGIALVSFLLAILLMVKISIIKKLSY